MTSFVKVVFNRDNDTVCTMRFPYDCNLSIVSAALPAAMEALSATSCKIYYYLEVEE